MTSMPLEEILTQAAFTPNDDQGEAIAHVTGPLLIKAGPGSGKTQVLVMRTLHLMLGPSQVSPKALVICTFTEKAAAQLRDRIASAVRAVAPATDLSDLMVGTIHGICRRILDEYLNQTPLKRGYQVLDDLTQRLFIYQNLKHIRQPDFGRPMGKTTLAGTLASYFNKITEEMIEPADLIAADDPLTTALGEAYTDYVSALKGQNAVDFAFLQRYVYDLTEKPGVKERLAERFTYFMVDEYQDTNYIQEQLLLRLSAPAYNLAVVGDDDQSLYRFRGATVRNLLEFPIHFQGAGLPSLTEVTLNLNYRSQREIVHFYDRFMSNQQWTGPDGSLFRFDKQMVPHRDQPSPYPAVIKLQATSPEAEAQQVAQFIHYLKEQQIIHDLNEVAVLLSSVKNYSPPYVAALTGAGIPSYAPRARQFFENVEVRAVVGALVKVLDFYEGARGDYTLESTWEYLDDSVQTLYAAAGRRSKQLSAYLDGMKNHLFSIPEGEASGFSLLDVFYQLMRYAPFTDFMANEASARNLAIFSRLLAQFQQYYKSRVLYGDSLERIRVLLFNSFLHMLIKEGLDEYEDPYDIFPSGHVQIMTIHQAKGLEFPVVIVGSLNSHARANTAMDELLGAYYHRSGFEPSGRIGEFDFLRKFYVAFSRAERVLLLSSGKKPNPRIRPSLTDLPDLSTTDPRTYLNLQFTPKALERPKPSFSLTSDVLVYDTCPRQYQMLKQFEFQPSAGGQMFFGMLVHHTIEDCHRHILEHGDASLGSDVLSSSSKPTTRAFANKACTPLPRSTRKQRCAMSRTTLRTAPISPAG